MAPHQDIKYWIAFTRIINVGPKKLLRLDTYFPTLGEAWRAPTIELRRAGLSERDAVIIAAERTKIHPDRELDEGPRAP